MPSSANSIGRELVRPLVFAWVAGLSLTLCGAAFAQSPTADTASGALEKRITDAFSRHDAAAALEALAAYHKLGTPVPPHLSLIEARLALEAKDLPRSRSAFEQFFATAKSNEPGYVEALTLYSQLKQEQQEAAKVAAARAQADNALAAERAKAAQAEAAKGRVASIVAEIASRMVNIPAGEFLMGDPEPSDRTEEHPAHKVRVPKFRLSKYEVTANEYAVFAAVTGRPLPDSMWEVDEKPASSITYLDARAFIEWLNANGGSRFRLPSEAEWEYAARAKSTTAFPWGKESLPGKAADGYIRAPVGSYPPNRFGIYDMMGNAWEWTADCWYEDYSGAPADGSARTCGPSPRKAVLRGGSRGDGSVFPVYSRVGADVDYVFVGQGFRLAQDP